MQQQWEDINFCSFSQDFCCWIDLSVVTWIRIMRIQTFRSCQIYCGCIKVNVFTWQLFFSVWLGFFFLFGLLGWFLLLLDVFCCLFCFEVFFVRGVVFLGFWFWVFLIIISFSCRCRRLSITIYLFLYDLYDIIFFNIFIKE